MNPLSKEVREQDATLEKVAGAVVDTFEPYRNRIAALEARCEEYREALESCLDFIADYEAEVGGISHHGEIVRAALSKEE